MSTAFTDYRTAAAQTQQIIDKLLSSEDPYRHLQVVASPPSSKQISSITKVIKRLQVGVPWHRLDEALRVVRAAMHDGARNLGKKYFLKASRDVQLALIFGALNNKARCFDAWVFDQACMRERGDCRGLPRPQWDAPGISLLASAYRTTDLHVLIKQRAPVEVIQLAIEWGAAVNALDEKEHLTPLHWFARENCWGNDGWAERVAQLLLNGGADSAIVDPNSLTALDYAAATHCHTAVKALWLAGAFYTRPETAEFARTLAGAERWTDERMLGISQKEAVKLAEVMPAPERAGFGVGRVRL